MTNYKGIYYSRHSIAMAVTMDEHDTSKNQKRKKRRNPKCIA